MPKATCPDYFGLNGLLVLKLHFKQAGTVMVPACISYVSGNISIP